MTDKLAITPWYQKGLKFQCTGCGKCCTGSPGAVWLKPREVTKIHEFLELTKSEFLEKYTHKIDDRLSLIEKEHYDCVFLEGKFCTIYPVRPSQCQTFPYWPGHLESEESWNALKHYCEGVNDEAPTTSLEEIEQQKKHYLDP